MIISIHSKKRQSLFHSCTRFNMISESTTTLIHTHKPTLIIPKRKHVHKNEINFHSFRLVYSLLFISVLVFEQQQKLTHEFIARVLIWNTHIFNSRTHTHIPCIALTRHSHEWERMHVLALLLDNIQTLLPIKHFFEIVLYTYRQSLSLSFKFQSCFVIFYALLMLLLRVYAFCNVATRGFFIQYGRKNTWKINKYDNSIVAL